ncbi:unnamed protein product, partial [Ectocarpus fasciculatus]
MPLLAGFPAVAENKPCPAQLALVGEVFVTEASLALTSLFKPAGEAPPVLTPSLISHEHTRPRTAGLVRVSMRASSSPAGAAGGESRMGQWMRVLESYLTPEAMRVGGGGGGSSEDGGRVTAAVPLSSTGVLEGGEGGLLPYRGPAPVVRRGVAFCDTNVTGASLHHTFPAPWLLTSPLGCTRHPGEGPTGAAEGGSRMRRWVRILDSSFAPVARKAGVGGGGGGSSEDGARVTAVPLSSTGVLEEGEGGLLPYRGPAPVVRRGCAFCDANVTGVFLHHTFPA